MNDQHIIQWLGVKEHRNDQIQATCRKEEPHLNDMQLMII